MRHFIPILALSLSACALTSEVQERADGTYTISGHAAPIRGGTVGAQDVAYKDAQRFCASRGARAVVLDSVERDIPVSSFGYNQYGGSGAMLLGGNATLNFKCQ